MSDKKDDEFTKKLMDTKFGQGYYENLVKVAIAAGIGTNEIKGAANMTVLEVEKLRKKYNKEIKDIETHLAIGDRFFDDLAKVRVSSLYHRVLDVLVADVECGKITGKAAADLFKYLDKQRSETGASAGGDGKDLSKEEIKKRALRLIADE